MHLVTSMVWEGLLSKDHSCIADIQPWIADNFVSWKLGRIRLIIKLDVYRRLIPNRHDEAGEMMGELVTPVKLHQD